MTQSIQTGARLKSTVCTTEVAIVKAATEDVDIRCGGRPLVPIAEAEGATGSLIAPFDGGTLIGKRYVDEELGLELLCTKAGDGSLSVGERLLTLKNAKPLPSSD